VEGTSYPGFILCSCLTIDWMVGENRRKSPPALRYAQFSDVQEILLRENGSIHMSVYAVRAAPHQKKNKNKRWVVYYDLQNVCLTTALPLASMQTLKVCHATIYQDDPASCRTLLLST
jgi:hypothetical protein